MSKVHASLCNAQHDQTYLIHNLFRFDKGMKPYCTFDFSLFDRSFTKAMALNTTLKTFDFIVRCLNTFLVHYETVAGQIRLWQAARLVNEWETLNCLNVYYWCVSRNSVGKHSITLHQC